MDSKAAASTNQRTYEDFQPITNLLTEERNTLEIHLPDFRKDQVRVQLDHHGNMRISGERPLEGNKWRRFHVNHRIPKDCNSSDIHAKFNDNVLQVILPKKTITTTVLDNPTQTQGPHTSPKTPREPKADKMNEQSTGGTTVLDNPTQTQGPRTSPKTPSEPKPDKINEQSTTDGIEDNKTKGESTGLEKKNITTTNTTNDNSHGSSSGSYQVPLGGYVIALHKPPRRLLVNVAVAVAVMVAAGAYAFYRVRSSSGKHEWSFY